MIKKSIFKKKDKIFIILQRWILKFFIREILKKNNKNVINLFKIWLFLKMFIIKKWWWILFIWELNNFNIRKLINTILGNKK